MSRSIFHRSALFGIVLPAMLLAGCSSTDPTRAVRALHEQSAPAFTLAATDGRVIRLSDYRGKVVVLNFLSTWSAACRREMPALLRLQERYAPRGFSFIGVAVSERKGLKGVQEFVREFGVNFPIAMGDTAMRKTYGGATVTPTSIVIDRDGIVVEEFIGEQGEGIYEAAISATLDRPAQAGNEE